MRIAEQYIEGIDPAAVVFESEGDLEIVVFEVKSKNKWGIPDYAFKYENDDYYLNVSSSLSPMLEKQLDVVKDIARKCWSVFKCRYFVRTDFRMDSTGKLFVLELNATQCLSPDTGMMRFSGNNYTQVIKKMIRPMSAQLGLNDLGLRILDQSIERT